LEGNFSAVFSSKKGVKNSAGRVVAMSLERATTDTLNHHYITKEKPFQEVIGRRIQAYCICGPLRHLAHANARRSNIGSDSNDGGVYAGLEDCVSSFFCDDLM
jgi:hypothetical protein